ncbi:MAG: PP2C family protein-serine/threonine phosphatase [Planctomycetota bacterium]
MSAPAELDSTVTMQCLQVWGGNEPTESTLKMTGLDGYLYAQPQAGAKSGGDVYYASSCASGRVTRVLLADVSGHGDVVSKMAQGLRDLMQRYVNFTSQKRFMKELNRRFGGISEVGRFATTLALSFYAPTRKLSLSNAGHPAPLWYHRQTGEWEVLGVNPDAPGEYQADLPLGVDDSTGYQQHEIDLLPGDMLLLYTDAFIESVKPDGKQLGISGFRELLSEIDVADPTQIVPKLSGMLSVGDPARLADDDATILLLYATGQKAEVKKMIMSPFNFVRGMAKGSLPSV